MNPLYHDAIERRLAVPLHEGPDKVTTLAEALRRHVHAGDTVYLGSAHGRGGLAPTLRRFDAPSADELALARLFDPRRYFLGDPPLPSGERAG